MSTLNNNPLGLNGTNDSPTLSTRNTPRLDYSRIFCISICLYRDEHLIDILYRDGQNERRQDPNASYTDQVGRDLLELGWYSRTMLFGYKAHIPTCMRVTYYNPDIVVDKKVII